MIYQGFDTYTNPGPQLFAELMGVFDFCTPYLESPSHHGHDWEALIMPLLEGGKGVLPIIVGQQITGLGSHIVTAAQGLADARFCASRLTMLGYPKGRRCALDIENGAPLNNPMLAYSRAFWEELGTLGWVCVLYLSHDMLAAVGAQFHEAEVFPYKIPTLDPTTQALPLPPAPEPLLGACAMQYRQNVTLLLEDGVHQLLDLSCAPTHDPGAAA